MPEPLSGDYLRQQGIDVIEVRPLGGGVSNDVLWVRTPAGNLVFKQSLSRLRVAEEWLFDQGRIVNERRCMEWLEQAMPGSAPMVRYRDDGNFIFGMTAVPDGGRVWKEALLAGEADEDAARSVGVLLREFHDRAAADANVARTFAGQDVFIQGRIDPYHRFTATRHPDLKPWIDAEVDRMLSHRRTLVHGDYSPKNLFVFQAPIQGGRQAMMIDFEVAHWGDPAFDLAFCLTHLILTTIHFPKRQRDFIQTARAYWSGYAPDAETAENAVRELGCLLLARIDGKSKEDYIVTESERSAARSLARDLITTSSPGIDRVWERFS